MSQVQPGLCRHCSCTHENACLLRTGDTCCWIDKSRTVCSNPACIQAEARRLAVARAKPRPPSRYAGWGYGAIVEDLRKRRRRRKRSA